MTDTDRNDELIEAAGRLATDIAPERDLWAGIAEEIARPRRSRWTPAFAQAAAVVLLIGASSGLTYLAMDREAQPVSVAPQGLAVQPASLTSHETFGPKYQQVRIDMAAQLDEQLAQLQPETRAEVEKNLALIRGAIADINKALAEDPDNVLLQEFLLGAYQDEVTLMHRVGGLTRHVMSRRDI